MNEDDDVLKWNPLREEAIKAAIYIEQFLVVAMRKPQHRSSSMLRKRFLENKGENRERTWYSITKGPYVRPMITDLHDPRNEVPEPISKMNEANRKRYTADVKVMNYILQAIPNDNSVDACKDAQKIKYVTLTRQNKDLSDVEYDSLYDTLLQFESHVQASKAKRAAKNHDPLALFAYSSQSHASPLYSHSPQPYYVTHPSSVVDYEEDYQRELQGDAQEDKLTTVVMNQVVINDGRVDIQTKNDGYGRNGNRNAGRQNKNQATNAGNDDNVVNMPKYDAEAVSEVNASYIDLISSMISKGVHEHTNHEKLKTIINTSDGD
ncbi:hypothetical protein Tco_0993278 [Tanacetum coccineum]|uniref:Uncharacterized protein n=1 Tax=Tanacetum coccineum TaxID=301880 RepID=A0ABQ5F5B4_9ASTR